MLQILPADAWLFSQPQSKVSEVLAVEAGIVLEKHVGDNFGADGGAVERSDGMDETDTDVDVAAREERQWPPGLQEVLFLHSERIVNNM